MNLSCMAATLPVSPDLVQFLYRGDFGSEAKMSGSLVNLQVSTNEARYGSHVLSQPIFPTNPIPNNR